MVPSPVLCRFSDAGDGALRPASAFLSAGFRSLGSCPAQRAGAQRLCAMTHSRRPAVLESIIDGSDRVSCPKADGLSLRRLRGYQLPLAAPQEEMESAK